MEKTSDMLAKETNMLQKTVDAQTAQIESLESKIKTFEGLEQQLKTLKASMEMLRQSA